MNTNLHSTCRSMSCRGMVLGLAAVLAVGCGNPIGGAAAAPQTVGGKVDSPCNSEFYDEGCYSTQGVVGGTRMKCDAATQKWSEIEVCGTGKVCAENTPTKKKTSCIVNQTTTGADTVSGGDATTGDGTTGGGDGTTGGGDGTTGGGDGTATQDIQLRKPSEIIACAQSKCSKELAACTAAPECKKLIDCVNSCSDGKCVEEKCKPSNPSDKAVQDIGVCLFQNECTMKTVCGDGVCNFAKENEQNCAADCAPKPKCNNNGKCDSGETPASCPADCKPDTACNNNGKCDAGETPANCASDCKVTTSCGNKVCEADKGENKTNCPQDCADVNPPACNNNGVCETPNENPENCPKDCKTTSSCGNGICESAKGENASTCPKDCQTTTTGGCGDLLCKSPESASSCAIDCASKFSSFAMCTIEMCSSEAKACAGNKNCMKFLECTGICGCDDSGCLQECVGPALSDTQAQQLMTALGKCSEGKKCPSPCGGSTSACNNNGTCEPAKGESPSNCPADCKQSTEPGCSVVEGKKGCGGCACEACVCKGPIPGGEASGDGYCCDTAWDNICVKECGQCGSCGASPPPP